MRGVLWLCVAMAAVSAAVAGRTPSCQQAGRQHHGGGGATASPNLDSDPITATPSGSIRGAWLYTRRGRAVRAYRGLRYAQPPVGQLRFQPPQPITQYHGEVNGTVDGPACPQPTFGYYDVDEDCLRLNVYAPATISKLLPVIVYMHPGGFYSLSGRSDVAGPSYLLDRDVVLVTINNRLASLGFLSTGDRHAPGNNGYKDQVVALRWVRRNIAAFGGDPHLVTIAGCSAGSFSVLLHMVSPMSKGLFHRAISMSGSPISQVDLPHDQKHLAVKQAELLDCPTNSSQAILECLKTKTSKELGDSLVQFFEFAYDPVLVWRPIIELDFGQERFLTENPLTSVKEGRIHAVPYIVSQTQDEFFWKALDVLNNETLRVTMQSEWYRIAPISFYLPPPSRAAADALRSHYLPQADGLLVNDSGTANGLGKLYSDALIGFGVHTLANLMAVYSPQPVYYYEFGYVGNSSFYVDPGTNRPKAAVHQDDLIYLFSINASFPIIPVSASWDSRLVDRMTAIWYNFAIYGDPNPTPATPELTFSWPRMTHRKRRYLRIDNGFSVREKLFEERFQVWERLYSPKDCSYCTH